MSGPIPSSSSWMQTASRQLVAGVPPDYFSKTGQLWGNPLYEWERMLADGFNWWINASEPRFGLVDISFTSITSEVLPLAGRFRAATRRHNVAVG